MPRTHRRSLSTVDRISRIRQVGVRTADASRYRNSPVNGGVIPQARQAKWDEGVAKVEADMARKRRRRHAYNGLNGVCVDCGATQHERREDGHAIHKD